MTPLALAAALLLGQTAASPTHQQTVVAPQWATVEVKADLANFYAEHVAAVLRQDGFKVITSAEISVLLASERQAQLLGCAADGSSCTTELANALGADFTLQGSVAKLEDTYRVHLKLVRSASGAVANETELEASGEKKLLEALTSAGHRLTEPLRAPTAADRLNVRKLSWLPFAFSGVSLAAGVYCFFASLGFYDDVKSKLVAPQNATDPKLLADAHTGKDFQTAGWVFSTVAAAAALGGVAMVVFGAPPEAPRPSAWLAPGAGGFALVGSF